MTTTGTTQPRIGPHQITILRAIQKNPQGLSACDIDAMGLFVDPRAHDNALKSLDGRGLLTYLKRKRIYRITRMGEAFLVHLDMAQKNKFVGVVTPPRRVMHTGIYTCPELISRPYRVGSDTASQIPSLFAGKRIPRGATA